MIEFIKKWFKKKELPTELNFEFIKKNLNDWIKLKNRTTEIEIVNNKDRFRITKSCGYYLVDIKKNGNIVRGQFNDDEFIYDILLKEIIKSGIFREEIRTQTIDDILS